MKIRSLVALASALLLVTACGGDSTGPDGGSGGSVTATIAGTAFSGSLATAAVHQQGVLSFAASANAGGGNARQLNIALGPNVNGPGTYTFGGFANTGNIAMYVEVEGGQTRSWTANMLVGSGTLTITELTSSRAVGTFSLNLQPAPNGNSTGAKAVTNGAFDLRLN